jgi:hypothetical protein
LVLDPLVEISGTEVTMWFWKIYCRIFHTWQRVMTDSSPMRRRKYDSLDGNEAKGDPLMDTTSHLPTTSAHSEKGELGGHQDNPASHQAKVLLRRATGGQGPEDRPPLATPMATPNPYSNPAFLEQLVKVVAERIAARTSSPASRVERVVTLVQWVKGMREMSCTTYSGEEDTGSLK